MTDHTSQIQQFLLLGIPIYLNKETHGYMMKLKGVKRYSRFLNVINYSQSYDIGDFIIKSFPLVHTSHVFNEETGLQEQVPCECSGFFIYEKSTKQKMVWITDTMYVENTFPALDYICIESNYFMGSITNTDDAGAVTKRKLISHMSFETCMEFINKQDLTNCKEVRLLHLSNKLTKEERELIRTMAIENIKKKDLVVIV